VREVRAERLIERRSMLLPTRVEYGDYAMNHVLGCAHGCRYPCYAYLMKRRFGQVASAEAWRSPALVSNTLELLRKEIPAMRGRIRSVHLCFTTDPFMYGYTDVAGTSLAALRTLNAAGIPCTVLTKGELPLELAGLPGPNMYGISLVSLDEPFRARMEPGAAPYAARLAALRALHDQGQATWASVEPYPTPNVLDQDLGALLEELSFVDRIVFGRTNYSREVTSWKGHREFYREQAAMVASFCRERGISCLIKEGTR
jgi:DNA repair photolyase